MVSKTAYRRQDKNIRSLEKRNKKLENELASFKKEAFFAAAEAKERTEELEAKLEAKIDSLSLALAGVMKKNRRDAYTDEMVCGNLLCEPP
jgi:hypothetical protein